MGGWEGGMYVLCLNFEFCFRFCFSVLLLYVPGGLLWISKDRDDRMGAKIKTPKNP